MNFIARSTWVRYTDAGTQREDDCAIFGTRKEAKQHLALLQDDTESYPGYTLDETWIDEEKE